jgi:hypothetical protein
VIPFLAVLIHCWQRFFHNTHLAYSQRMPPC